MRDATDVLVRRYDTPDATAEAALMDWSRVTDIDIHRLAARVVADARRATILDP